MFGKTIRFLKNFFLKPNYQEKDCAACGARGSMYIVESRQRDDNDSSVDYPVEHLKCKVCGERYAGKYERINELHMTIAERKALSRLYQRVREIEDKLGLGEDCED